MKNIQKFNKSQICLLCVIAVVFISTIFSFVLFLFPSIKSDAKSVYKNSIKSVVEIKAETTEVGESFGTAVFVDDAGTLITNAHVVTYKESGVLKTFDNIAIRFADEVDYHEVTLKKFNSNKDIAVLQLVNIDCNFKSISFVNSANLEVGEKVYAIGNLNNAGISLTEGVVSNLNVEVELEKVKRQVIQCDITIAEGNSGGALLNENGEIVGLTTFRLKDASNNVIYGIAYCILANTILEYIKN